MSKNGFPSISIPPNKDKNITVDRLREVVEIWKGERGNALDQVVLYRDLIGADLARFGRNGRLTPGPIFNQPPVYIGPLTDLSANGGFRIVFLAWDGEDQENYAYTEIFRASDDNLANAVMVGTSVPPIFVDASVGSNQTYYYWVRAVSTSGNKSAFNATAGTSATTVFEPDHIIEIIEGMIGESELAAELLTPIQSIPTIQQTLDDHDIRLPVVEDYVDTLNINVADFGARIPLLEADSDAHSLHLTQLDAKVAAFRNIPVFSQKSYLKDELARYGGVVWKALVNLTPPVAVPEEGPSWTNIGNYTTYDGVLSGQAQAIEDAEARITTAEGVITSHSSSISSLQSSVTNANTNITANANAVNALDTRVTSTETTIASQASSIQSIQASLNDLIISEFDVNQNYAIDDVFRYNSEYYTVIATQTPPNATPPNATYYQVSPEYASLQGAVSANASAIGALDTRVTAAEGTITSHSTSITNLQADISSAQGDITANSNAASALDTRLTTAEGTLTAHTSSITALNISATANADDIVATNTAVSSLTGRVTTTESDITSLNADVTALENSLTTASGQISANSTAIADLNALTTTQGGQITAISNDITLLNNEITSLEGADQAASTAIGQLTSRVTQNEGDIDAQSLQLISLSNSINNIDSAATINADAINLLDSRVTTTEQGISGLSQDITQLQTDVAAIDTSGAASLYNQLSTRVDATENSIQVISGDVQTINSAVNNNYAAIQDKAEASVVASINGEVQTIKAQRTIKLDVNGRVSGIGLMNDGATSEMIVASDAVYFIDPGQSVTQFVPGNNYASMDAVRNTQLVFGYARVEGQYRFVINVPAYIPDGTITTAQIQNATINQAQIQNLLVQSAQIADGAITDAKIGNIIQSSNYIPGTRGWRLNKAGEIEAHNIVIYDGNGNVAFQSGYSRINEGSSFISNGLLFNPNMEIETNIQTTPNGEYSKPAGWNMGRDINSLDSILEYHQGFYAQGLRVAKIVADWSTGYFNRPAFSVRNMKNLRFKMRVRGGGNALGQGDCLAQVRAYYYSGDYMPQNASYVSWNRTTPDSVVADGYVQLLSQQVYAGTWYEKEATFTLPAGANFCSVMFLLSPGSQLYVDYVDVFEDFGELAAIDQVSTTYIADAAITEAKIRDAEISTLKIQGNAVTVIQMTEFVSGYYSNTSWNAVGSFVVSHGYSGSVLILFDISSHLSKYSGGLNTKNEGRLRFDVNGQSYISDPVDMYVVRSGSAVGSSLITYTSTTFVRIRKAIQVPNNSLVTVYVTGSSDGSGGGGVRQEGTTATAVAAKR